MVRKDDKIIDITNDVRWIGILDHDIRTFDIVMSTEFGTTYNSFFINADKKAIVEVAKEKFFDTYIEKLKKVVDPKDISYIILDHTEPDHSGSIAKLLKLAPSATVVGSGNAIRYMNDIANVPFKSLIVKDGDKLDLGNKTLTFIAAPNLHWPDSIYTYLAEDRILFTCDSFGAHYCSENIFSEFTPEYSLAFKYYFDVILKPFSKFMLKAIEKINPFEFDFICPGHGPIHGKNLQKAIDLSRSYSEEYLDIIAGNGKKNVLVAYISAYGYTKEGAQLIAAGINTIGGIDVDVVDIENISPAELDAKITRANGIIVGSPTINQNTLLPVYTLFALVNPLRDRGKLGGSFGSYGWSGEAPKMILENLRLLKLNIFDETAAFKFAPGCDKGAMLVEYGKKYAKKLVDNSEGNDK